MPELPEIETIKRELSCEIVGKKLEGVKVTDVRRRAKILMIDLADGSSLIFHLKLTGQLLLNARPGKYTRAVFKFTDGTNLVFNNVRKFGWWKRVKDTSEIEKDFGPEPLTKDFTLKKFKEILSHRTKSKIKPLLMDQQFIAGIGNIYSDEILLASGVRPTRRVKTLNEKEIKRIFQKMKEILKEAIKYQGSSIQYYVDARGQRGKYVKYHQVYGREGEPCKKCGTIIKRIKIGSRSAHFCPICQK